MEAFEASRSFAIADLVARHKVAQSEYAEAGQGLSEKGATVDVFEVL